MRQYQPIWEGLKKNGKVSITAPPKLHPRIIKAVIKEKYNDTVFKIYLDDNRQKARIEYTRSGTIIHFSLIKSIGLDGI